MDKQKELRRNEILQTSNSCGERRKKKNLY